VKAAIVSGLALVASVVTPVFADEVVGPPTPEAEVVAEVAPVEAEKPAGKPLELRPNRASDSGGAGGFGIGMKLAAVAAVFGGAFLLFKRKNGGFASKARTPGTNARIVSRTAVGMRNELLVVEVEGQRLLIGVTPSAMSTLSVLADEPKELVEDPEKISGYQLSNYRQAIPPAAPLPSSAVEESLSRLIANARNELDEASFIRKTPVPKVTQLRAQRTKAEKADKIEKIEKIEKTESTGPVEKIESMPATRKTRGSLREVASLGSTSGLEGQVRGLTAKRG
jgi:flagellar protein FliO/FliZ